MDLGSFWTSTLKAISIWKGISNAVEMSTTELGYLPNEILERVFSNLSNVERQHLRRVCKKWRAVVTEIFGIKLVISNVNQDLMFSSEWAVEVDFVSMTKLIVDKKKIAFVDKVIMITFRHVISFYNLIPILEACKNIQELCFHEVLVDLPERSIQMPTTEISLLQLKKLELSCDESLKRILSFLAQINFGQLEEITVLSKYSPVLPVNLIFLRPPPQATAHPEIHSLNRLVLKNIRTLKLFVFGRVRTKFYPFNIFGSPALEEVEISLKWDWTQTLQEQTHLKKLEVCDCKAEQWGELRNAITRNASTLTKVKVNGIGIAFGQAWDCGVFQPTHFLEILTLNIYLSQKTGLGFLPISLTFLDIVGPISLTELVTILNLINLEELYFKKLGVHLVNDVVQYVGLTERIDLRLFKRFLLQLPRLKILSFQWCSPNSLAWDEIGDWCLRISELHQVNLRQIYDFCDGNGQKFISGISLTLPENIISNRSVLLEDPFDDPLEYLDLMSVMCTACFSALGL